MHAMMHGTAQRRQQPDTLYCVKPHPCLLEKFNPSKEDADTSAICRVRARDPQRTRPLACVRATLDAT